MPKHNIENTKQIRKASSKYFLLLWGMVLVVLALLSDCLARVPDPNTDLLPPLIPYSAKTIDRAHIGCVSPWATQNVGSCYFRHWLGTDEIGRDVAAGILAGLRNALIIGVSTMFLSGSIGLLIGLSAGFWGNERLKLPFLSLLLRGCIIGLNIFWLIQFSKIEEKKMYDYLIIIFLLIISWAFTSIFLAFIQKYVPFLMRPFSFPIEGILMRLTETIQIIPSLFILLAVAAVVPSRNILSIIILLSIFSWVSIARLVRSATLQLKNKDFIIAASALGLSDAQILWRHILPNVMPLVWVNVALGIANTIAAEAMLSFLGLGMPLEEVTWGGMLHTSRYIPSAWWLAVSAGLAIFATIRYFEALSSYFSSFIK